LALDGDQESPSFYIAVYAGITAAGLTISTLRWFVLYNGSIRASAVLYKRLLETILFANIRFHDTVSRGRVLNRFGKDFEGWYQSCIQLYAIEIYFIGIDSSLSDNFGRSIIYALSVLTTLITVSFVGGLPFIFAIGVLGIVYYNGMDTRG
jgi:ABC-type multidrug transport system fused ATPase/permease subunit